MKRMHEQKRLTALLVSMVAVLTLSAQTEITIDGIVYTVWSNENSSVVRDGSEGVPLIYSFMTQRARRLVWTESKVT